MERFPGMILTEERANAYLEQGVWTKESFVDVLWRNVRERPDLEHRDEKRRLSYEGLWNEVESFAASLRDLGIKKGDRVAIQMPNSLDYVVAVFGSARIGAVAVLLQTDLGRQALTYSLEKSGSAVWIVADSYRGANLLQTARELKAELPLLRHIVLQGDESGTGGTNAVAGQTAVSAEGASSSGDGLLRFHELSQTDKRLTPAEVQANRPGPLDAFVMVFTSGTTGSPKGVVQLHANYLWASRAYAKIYGFESGQATLNMAPICHQTGMLVGVMMTVATCGRIILLERFSATRVLNWIREEKPTYLCGAPPHVIHVTNAPGLKEADTSSVKVFIYAGAPVPSAVLRQLQEDTGITVGGMFGWSEGFVSCCTRLDDPIEIISSSCGLAVPGVEIQLVDEEGQPVPQGTPGEMWSRGPNFSAGYFGNPEASARQWDKDGWFHSGDLLRQDESGRYVFMGRADDIINRGGTKVDPKAVEDACASHPSVQNVAVVGVPDDTLGQHILACIVLKEGMSPFGLAELRDLMASQGLGKFQTPDELMFVRDLPMTHSGKIRKKEIRQRLEAGQRDW